MLTLSSGDLLFVRPKKDGLDQSISKATKRTEDVSYSHVAIVDAREADGLKAYRLKVAGLKTDGLKSDGPLVIEATGDDGVVADSWESFLKKNQGRIDVYRYNGEFADLNSVLDRALKQVGQPYNHGFFQAGPGFYCSQLVTYAFENEGIFEETPLRFGPNGTVLPEWVDYYADLGRPVPVGELGSSPNSLLEGNGWTRTSSV